MSTVIEPSSRRPRQVAEQVASMARRMLGADTRVYWFGSWAEGRAVERSDVDVGIIASRPIPLDQFSRLRGAVEELPTLYMVDLVDLNAVGAELRERAVTRGICL
jgi:predicted nucleotidyltransferase